MIEMNNWLRAELDKKPWWAIIAIAMLTALGSEAVKSFPAAVTWARSFWPIEPTVFVYLTRKGAGQPINGADISVMQATSQTALRIIGSQKTAVSTKMGVATLKVRLMPGPGYLLDLNYFEGGKTYQKTVPIEIRGDMQQLLEFDPAQWFVVGTTGPSVASTSPLVEIPADAPPWMRIAFGEIGQRELVGPQHNPRILEYFRATKAPRIPQDDETDWSSAFTHWVLSQVGIAGTRSLLDRSWITWGKPSELKPGCIAVFWRESPTSEAAHSGFLVGLREDGNLMILGGNQSNAVQISTMQRARLLGCRWPA